MVERKRHNILCNQLVNTLLHNSYSKYVVYYILTLYLSHKLLNDTKNQVCSPPKNFEINSIPKEWGGPCNVKIMHKGIGSEKLAICKMAILKHYLQLHQFEKIVFFGDGSNDLCLSLYLSSNDIIFPREGYKLASLLDQHCVQANVITWKDGFDIVKHIQNLQNLMYHKVKIDSKM